MSILLYRDYTNMKKWLFISQYKHVMVSISSIHTTFYKKKTKGNQRKTHYFTITNSSNFIPIFKRYAYKIKGLVLFACL